MDDKNLSSVQFVPAKTDPRQFQEMRRPVATSKWHCSGRQENESLLIFVLRWTCLVLTVAATIVFGIWAPLSYKATVDANNDGNVAQSSAMSVALAANDLAASRNYMATHAISMASTANDIASDASKVADAALSIAASQSSVLDAVQTRIAAVGQLWLMDFCVSRTTFSACSSYFETLNFNALASSLAAAVPQSEVSSSSLASCETAAPTSTTESSTSTNSAAASPSVESSITASWSFLPSSTTFPTGAPPSAKASRSGPSLPVAAILGIVFGIVGFVGALAGAVVWRYRQNRPR